MSTDNTKQHLLTFFSDLLLTNSPSTRLNALYEFLRQEQDFFTKEEQDLLILSFKQAQLDKSKAGKTDAQKRWDKLKNNSEQRLEWIYKEHSDYAGVCKACSLEYCVDDPIFINKKRGHHVTCTPQEIKDNHSYYQRCINKERS